MRCAMRCASAVSDSHCRRCAAVSGTTAAGTGGRTPCVARMGVSMAERCSGVVSEGGVGRDGGGVGLFLCLSFPLVVLLGRPASLLDTCVHLRRCERKDRVTARPNAANQAALRGRGRMMPLTRTYHGLIPRYDNEILKMFIDCVYALASACRCIRAADHNVHASDTILAAHQRREFIYLNSIDRQGLHQLHQLHHPPRPGATIPHATPPLCARHRGRLRKHHYGYWSLHAHPPHSPAQFQTAAKSAKSPSC